MVKYGRTKIEFFKKKELKKNLQGALLEEESKEKGRLAKYFHDKRVEEFNEERNKNLDICFAERMGITYTELQYLINPFNL